MRSWALTMISSVALHGAALALASATEAEPPASGPSPARSEQVHILIVEQSRALPSTPKVAALSPRIRAKPLARRQTKPMTHNLAQVPLRQPDTPRQPGEGVGGLGGGSGIPPKLIRDSVVEPPYSSDALLAKFQGLLVVSVKVDEEGRVREARLTNPSGFAIDAGVLEAARRARYVAARSADGAAVTAEAQLKFHFRIP